MDDFTRRIAREQFALGRMQVGAVALPEIFPVLDGQMVPIEEIPKMVQEGKIETVGRRRTGAEIRPVPPGIHGRLPQDAFAFARTCQRNELSRAGSSFGAGRRSDRGAEGKIRQHADRRVSRGGPAPRLDNLEPFKEREGEEEQDPAEAGLGPRAERTASAIHSACTAST